MDQPPYHGCDFSPPPIEQDRPAEIRPAEPRLIRWQQAFEESLDRLLASLREPASPCTVSPLWVALPDPDRDRPE